jgi:hypothetical protein
MMKKILALLAIALAHQSSFAQVSAEFTYPNDGAILDIEKQVGEEVDFLYSCGLIAEEGQGLAVINKTDVSGNLQWSIVFNEPELAEFRDLEVLNNEDIMAVGQSFEEGEGKGIIAHLNSDGEVLSLKSISLNTTLYLKAIRQKSNGNFLILAQNNYDGILFEMDNTGQILQSKKIGTDERESFYNFAIDNEENIILVGAYSDSNFAEEEGLVVKLDENLELLWSKLIYREVSSTETPVVVKDCEFNGINSTLVLQVPGDDLEDIQSRARDIGVLELTSEGEIASENIIDLGFWETPEDLELSESGNLFITGVNTPFSISDRFESFVLELNNDLEFTGANLYARAVNDIVFLNSTLINDENNFVATGGQGQNGSYHMYQTHNAIGVDNCLANAIQGTSYDPEFIIEDIDIETSDLEPEVGDLDYVMNEMNDDLNLVCSEFLSNDNLPDQEEISLFPNPCQNSFTIEGLDEKTPVRILNVLGEEFLKTDYQSGKINTSHLPDGMYLVEVNGSQTFRLIKQ